MFRGRYEHTIDAKGRTSVPARYRDALSAAGERRIVLTSALDPCLVAYAPPSGPRSRRSSRGCRSSTARCRSCGASTSRARSSARSTTSAASSCRPRCASTPRLKKDVLWAGAGRYAELWDKDAWQRHFETTDDEKRDIAARLAELGL